MHIYVYIPGHVPSTVHKPFRRKNIKPNYTIANLYLQLEYKWRLLVRNHWYTQLAGEGTGCIIYEQLLDWLHIIPSLVLFNNPKVVALLYCKLLYLTTLRSIKENDYINMHHLVQQK